MVYKQPKKHCINRKITSSNQLWEIDIKYGYIKYEKRHFMICEIIDVFDRSIVEFHIGNNCKAKKIKHMIRSAFTKRGTPKNLVIRTDNGSQFTSKIFKEVCDDLKIHHERIPNATPNKVAHIEAFHSLLERELLRFRNFWCLQQAYKEIQDYIEFYNTERYHGSLNYKAPLEYYELQKNDNFKGKVVNL